MGLLKNLRLKIIGYTDEEIMSMMSSIKVSDKAIKQYKFHVKNNRQEDRRTLTNKLKRNVLISKDIQVDKNGREKIVHYGNLTIIVLDDTIMKVSNKLGQPREFKVYERLRKRINELYWLWYIK